MYLKYLFPKKKKSNQNQKETKIYHNGIKLQHIKRKKDVNIGHFI